MCVNESVLRWVVVAVGLGVASPASAQIKLGIEVSDAPRAGAGARVESVTAGGYASQAGIMVGDLIVKVNDTKVGGKDKLISTLKAAPKDVYIVWFDGRKYYRTDKAVAVTTPIGKPPQRVTYFTERVECTAAGKPLE